MQSKKKIRRLKDHIMVCRMWQTNINELQMHDKTEWMEKKMVTNHIWRLMEPVKLRAKSTVQQHCTLVKKIYPMGTHANNPKLLHTHWSWRNKQINGEHWESDFSFVNESFTDNRGEEARKNYTLNDSGWRYKC